MNLTTATALALFLAASALWVRSYFVFDRFEYNSTATPPESQLHVGAESNADEIAIGYVYYRPSLRSTIPLPPPPFTPGTDRREWPAASSPQNPIRAFARENGIECAGFGYFAWDLNREYQFAAGRRVANYGVVFPHWAAGLLSGLIAAWGIRRIVRRRRLAEAGRCAVCGYDLRATPDRCPECGKVPEPAPAG